MEKLVEKYQPNNMIWYLKDKYMYIWLKFRKKHLVSGFISAIMR